MSAARLPAATCESTVADAPCGASSAAAQSTGTAAARRTLRRFMSSRSVACRALRVDWRPYPTTTPPRADPSRLDPPHRPAERREAIGPLGVLRGRAYDRAPSLLVRSAPRVGADRRVACGAQSARYQAGAGPAGWGAVGEWGRSDGAAADGYARGVAAGVGHHARAGGRARGV